MMPVFPFDTGVARIYARIWASLMHILSGNFPLTPWARGFSDRLMLIRLKKEGRPNA
jgi:hypothetical protein